MRFFLFLLLFTHTILQAQTENEITRLTLQTDTFEYTWPQDAIVHYQSTVLPVFYNEENEICEVKFWTQDRVSNIKLVASGDYELLDSLLYTGEYYRFKVRFRRLTRSEFLKFSFSLTSDSFTKIIDIPLQPHTKTSARIHPNYREFFIGEENVIEIITNNPDNIIYSNEWTENRDIDYRMTEKNGNLYVHLIPNKLGIVKLEIPVRLRKPTLTPSGNFGYLLEPIIHAFNVKTSRLQYLGIDKKELTMDETTRREGIEVQFDDSRLFQMNKTYCIESQQESGGALIAEIFTMRRLENNRYFVRSDHTIIIGNRKVISILRMEI